jgi:DNA damage-inducible protein 1
VFGTVEMLYVDMAANGEPLKVFVDSGAQMTIMTQTCAEKCNLMRLVDKRFQGMAVGVGSNAIIGRIHHCDLKARAPPPCHTHAAGASTRVPQDATCQSVA